MPPESLRLRALELKEHAQRGMEGVEVLAGCQPLTRKHPHLWRNTSENKQEHCLKEACVFPCSSHTVQYSWLKGTQRATREPRAHGHDLQALYDTMTKQASVASLPSETKLLQTGRRT